MKFFVNFKTNFLVQYNSSIKMIKSYESLNQFMCRVIQIKTEPLIQIY
jgi:hypothetical protein